MKADIFVEDIFFFKYIGCSTLARTLYRQIQNRDHLDVSWNSYNADFDVVHYHSFGPMALTHRSYSKGVKILTAHSTPRLNDGNVAFSNIINNQYPKIYGKFDHIIAITPPSQREIQAMLPDMETTLIPNGVNRDKFRPDEEKRRRFRECIGVPDDATVVLTVAQETPRKGIYDFLHLAQHMPDVTFVWVGGYPYSVLSKDYARIEYQKRNLGKNCIFTGFVPDITEAYAGADIFFMPSYAEIMPMVLLEALSCGVPVVARDIPEFREVFGPASLLFRDIHEAESLLRDETALQQKKKLSRSFTEPFDIGRIADEHIRTYRRLAEEA
ncbi:MAG: glycosyltransferase family 1 protein [Methanocalculus sp. MSAO_Arc1]|uniref:glycosyltransferase family 4 protein n=1 Tax=Methanocalculus TaxID=71151 RepID=UPI000FF59E6B|nr:MULTISPECIES: glycosyltransferase family 4 protein [unclassified Methanocalculus]MCP1661965.1 glycosyltransferase involved in cell wall biosynthesis [Methanocalculus sp. AMF5]RQD81159.1 MAG: glycosyltransferase family 1 protein [Methanocalculus sp. MSAO_Arc1]